MSAAAKWVKDPVTREMKLVSNDNAPKHLKNAVVGEVEVEIETFNEKPVKEGAK